MSEQNFELFVDHCNVCTRWPCALCGSAWDKKGGQPVLKIRNKTTGESGDVCDDCAKKINAGAFRVYTELWAKLTEAWNQVFPEPLR